MKKQFLLLLTAIFVSSSLFAQQPPNQGFETWTSQYNPDGWTTIASGMGAPYNSILAPLAVKDNADFIEAAASIKLTTTTFGPPVSQTLPGIVGQGTLNTSTYTFSGIAFPYHPDTFWFAAKYAPSGADQAAVKMVLRQGGATVAGGTYQIPPSASWGLYTIDLTSWTGTTPADSLYLEFYSSASSPVAGSVLNVDAVFFTYPTPAAPTVSISAAQSTVPESVGTTTFTATLSAAATGAITVPVTFSGTATGGGTDYSVSPSSFSFTAGQTTSTITVTVVDDALTESSETVIATLGTPTGATLGTPTSATITISDNDAVGVPSVSISASQSTVAENVGTTTFTATLSAAASGAVTVPVTFSGTATGGGTDYSVSPSSFSFSAGQTTSTITVTVVDDALTESSETVIATLGSPTGANLGSPSTATITITDNDGGPVTPTLSISASPASVSESAGTANFTVTLSQAAASTVTATVSLAGTATSGTDYNATGTSVSIPAGSTTATVSLSIVDDVLVEGNETVVATLTSPSGATLGTASATLVIIDNDGSSNVPSVSISASASTVGEASGTAVTITATLSAASTIPVTVGVNFSGTAVNPADYAISGTVFTFPAGSTIAYITVTVVDDAIYEGTETIFISVNSLSGATLGQPASLSITINDDETPSSINEPEGLRAINAYPNPARDYVKVAMSTFDSQLLHLVDLQGRIVKTATIVSGENLIDITDLHSGSYVLRFTNMNTQEFTGARPLLVVK